MISSLNGFNFNIHNGWMEQKDYYYYTLFVNHNELIINYNYFALKMLMEFLKNQLVAFHPIKVFFFKSF